VQLKEGKSYTMKIQFKKTIGINVPASDINLTQNGCTANDKTALAKLTWADGNLKSTGASNNYVWGTNSEYGYYYAWNKDYSGNNIDPCTRLKSDYGTGWRTPSRNECLPLSRCTNKTKVNNGMWFMNNSKGLFLPLAGARTWSGGSGTSATESGYARYWTSTNNSGTIAYSLNFENNKVEVNSSTKGDGFSVRCVKNK
jgi:uncharacterized protein (TIGR02145 family)